MTFGRFFLACALATQPMSFSGNGHKNGYRSIAQTIDFLTWREESRHGKVLFVHADPELIGALRLLRVQAFGTVPRWYPAPRGPVSVVNDSHLPFRPDTFVLAWYTQENCLRLPLFWQVREITRLVRPAGFLVFSEDVFPMWRQWLETKEWFRLPFTFNGYSVWQKPQRRIEASA